MTCLRSPSIWTAGTSGGNNGEVSPTPIELQRQRSSTVRIALKFSYRPAFSSVGPTAHYSVSITYRSRSQLLRRFQTRSLLLLSTFRLRKAPRHSVPCPLFGIILPNLRSRLTREAAQTEELDIRTQVLLLTSIKQMVYIFHKDLLIWLDVQGGSSESTAPRGTVVTAAAMTSTIPTSRPATIPTTVHRAVLARVISIEVASVATAGTSKTTAEAAASAYMRVERKFSSSFACSLPKRRRRPPMPPRNPPRGAPLKPPGPPPPGRSSRTCMVRPSYSKPSNMARHHSPISAPPQSTFEGMDTNISRFEHLSRSQKSPCHCL